MLSHEHLLVLGRGPQSYREQLFRDLSDHNIWLLSDQEPTWERKYLSGFTVIPRLNSAQVSTNLRFMVDAVLIIAESMSIVGIVTFEEMFLPASCVIADCLGLPSIGLEAAENCRDKARTRSLLTEAGLRQPRFGFARDVEQARSVARETGYPLVLKPRGLAGSVGVVMVNHPDDLDEAFRIATAAARDGAQRHGGGALVEEFVAGHEISIDCAVHEGGIKPLFLAHKRFGPEPFFEETGQLIDAQDPLLTDPELLDTLRCAHQTLGVRTGVTHTEVKLTEDGPLIIEVNGRLAGDFVSHLASHAMGINAAAVVANLASGHQTRVARELRKVASVEVVYAYQKGTFESIDLPNAVRHPLIVDMGQLIEPKAEVELPPKGYMSRCGFVIAVADDVESCSSALAAAVAEMTVNIRGGVK